MTPFRRKRIQSNKTLGERLQAVREERGDSLEAIAKKLQIRKDYLSALESGQYGNLPGEVYIRNFLKTYAIELELNPLSVLRLYEKEKAILVRGARQRVIKAPKTISRWKFFTASKLFRPLLIIPVIAGIVIYLSIQINAILSPPPLDIYEPADNLVTNERSITIMGKSEGASDVMINGQLVHVSTDGVFSETISLHSGLNVIQISSAKKHSKEAIVERHVLVESPATALQGN